MLSVEFIGRNNMFKTIEDPQGFKDGGKITITCDKCGKELITIWSVKPEDKDEEITVSAFCPFCEEETDGLIVFGKFYTSIGIDGESKHFISYEANINDDGDKVTFKLEKA